MSPEETVLHHEAGHAVVALRLQIPFCVVEVRAGGNGEVSVGVGPLESAGGSESDEEISRWQLFYAGGAAAERLFFGDYRKQGAKVDRAHHEKLEKMRSAERNCAWDLDIQSAMKVLDRESVQKIADALGQHRRLDEEGIHDLLGCKPSWW
jgi:hypothetical protein